MEALRKEGKVAAREGEGLERQQRLAEVRTRVALLKTKSQA